MSETKGTYTTKPKSKFVQRDSVKKLVFLSKVNTPDGIGLLLGRGPDSPETDSLPIEGGAVIVLAVQFCDQDMRGRVGFYASNLVEAVE